MGELVKYSDSVTKLTTEIKVIQDNVCQGMIEIGKRLIEIKKELRHGQWLPYLENELGYKPTTAGRLIRIANEFGTINCSALNNLQSSKIIALLDVPVEHREEFIGKTDIDNKTLRQLQDEIKLFKKQFDDSLFKVKELENKKKQLQQELQLEKNKPPKIETKVEYKERVVDKTDYSAIERNRQLEKITQELESKNKSLENTLKTNQQLLSNYKTDSEEYRKLRSQMAKLQVEMDSQAQKTVSVLKLTELASEIEFFLYNKLAPTKYKDFMGVINEDDVVKENFIHTIELVGSWYREMNTYINQNNYENIITVEVN